METVKEIVDARLTHDPDRPFLKYGDGDWLTIAQLRARVDRVATGMARLGMAKGDRVAVLLPSRVEALELFLACARSGIINVAVNPYLRGDFLLRPLEDSGARMLITDAAGLAAARSLLTRTRIEVVVLVDGAAAGPESIHDFATLTSEDAALLSADIVATDLVSIVYTSGTTGLSKGCMLGNGYFTHVMEPYRTIGWIAPGDRIFTAFAFSHLSGPLALIAALRTPGASLCYEPQFDAATFLRRAKDVGASVLFGVGAMGNAILAQPPRTDDADHRLRLAIWIPMAEAPQLEWERRFGFPVVGEGIGQTECTPMTLGRTDKRGSLGMPVDHLDLRIVDSFDREVPVGEAGELVVRSRVPHGIFSGYWNMPEATVQAWRNLWHHTGDLVRADPDGCLHYVDRNKDSIRRRGQNISSFELELAVMRHPQVERAAAIAVPSPDGQDEEVKLCLVPCAGAEIDLADFFAFARESLPYYAVPRYVEIRADLPVTPATGRVQKHILRQEGVNPATIDLAALGYRVLRHDRRVSA